MRSYWIRVCPKSSNLHLYKKRDLETHTQKENNLVKMETEIGVVLSQTRKCQELSATTTKLGRDKKGLFPRLQKENGPAA